ncbi:amino acid permease-domain-containing protein [Suillus tomentosus]|nr:amino acid permease-domain-containing protein [Suillus tomentosus]
MHSVRQQYRKGLSNSQNGQALIGGFQIFNQTFINAFYSFGGVELVAVTAGESVRPHQTIPRAIRATFLRIVLFYILTILTIGLRKTLRAADDSYVTASTLTVVFQRARFGTAAHVVNAVLLTAVLVRPLASLWVTSRGVFVPALVTSRSQYHLQRSSHRDRNGLN